MFCKRGVDGAGLGLAILKNRRRLSADSQKFRRSIFGGQNAKKAPLEELKRRPPNAKKSDFYQIVFGETLRGAAEGLLR